MKTKRIETPHMHSTFTWICAEYQRCARFHRVKKRQMVTRRVRSIIAVTLSARACERVMTRAHNKTPIKAAERDNCCCNTECVIVAISDAQTQVVTSPTYEKPRKCARVAQSRTEMNQI